MPVDAAPTGRYPNPTATFASPPGRRNMSSAIVNRVKPASLLAAVILLAVLAALPVGPGRGAGRCRRRAELPPVTPLPTVPSMI